jgi:hypothetical protein
VLEDSAAEELSCTPTTLCKKEDKPRDFKKIKKQQLNKD